MSIAPFEANHPAKIAMKSEKMQRIGTMSVAATTLGSSTCETLERPRLSSASICSVTRIVPSSAAKRAPMRPARINAVSTGPSSSMMVDTTTPDAK